METLNSINIDQIRTDFKKYPKTIFWLDEKGGYLAEYCWGSNKFWVSYRKIWQEYESTMGWFQIGEFLKSAVEDKFKLGEISVNPTTTDGARLIEDHFLLL